VEKDISIIQEIQEWSKTIPDWQQDAISRLFFKGALDVEDYSELYALLKASQGIALPHGLKAQKLAADQVPAAPPHGKLVKLVTIKNLANVNALADGQSLEIAENGLTVIYGANGSGKSGYSRVLKKACRARDQSEDILPDAKLPPGKTGKPCASFDLLVDGKPTEVKWVYGQPSPDLLSSIAIFDAHCARAYIDDQDDFSYVPYGLDILEGLAKACNHLKIMLDNEYANSTPNLMPFSKLAETSTNVGKLLKSLSANIKAEAIETLATMSGDELARHEVLEKGLKEANPKEKAQLLTLFSGRIAKLVERCTEKLAKVNDLEVAKLRELIEASSAARAIADLAAKTFKETPDRLPGTGGDAWQELFAAARKFASESHPGQEFPNLSPESLCPFCQQPLGDAAHRLVAFDHFIQQEAEKNARTKRDAAKNACVTLLSVDLNILFDSELKTELEPLDALLVEQCAALQPALNARRETIKAACEENGSWAAIAPAPIDPCTSLTALSQKLLVEASALGNAADDETRVAMEIEFKGLDARKQLITLKPAVLDALSRLQLQKNLKSCQSLIMTRAISHKSSELVDKVLSKGLADALNVEFKQLDVGHLHVSLNSTTTKGKTFHKLVIKLPGAMAPRDILSEGEQRAIAIASFLAEINIGGGKGGAVFDDPISSLDHRRREQVVKRLIEEATKRQIIVFTHDLYFLSLLQQKAQSVGTQISSMSLSRTASGFGVVSPTLPFDGANTKTRVGMLKQIHIECLNLYRNHEEEAYAKLARDAYLRLRDAWERAIEEVLLNGVVWRFKVGLSTQSLREVEVDDTDYATINTGMSQCSKFAHDGSANAIVSIPTPDELLKDIMDLDTWRDATIKRRDKLKQQRPK
jgi:energy-coupling factor transporter ATP-binding protein EcfA2